MIFLSDHAFLSDDNPRFRFNAVNYHISDAENNWKNAAIRIQQELSGKLRMRRVNAERDIVAEPEDDKEHVDVNGTFDIIAKNCPKKLVKSKLHGQFLCAHNNYFSAS